MLLYLCTTISNLFFTGVVVGHLNSLRPIQAELKQPNKLFKLVAMVVVERAVLYLEIGLTLSQD